MRTDAAGLGQEVGGCPTVLKDDGLAFMEYTEQITYLLFMKMVHERETPGKPELIPVAYGWDSLLKRRGPDLTSHYALVLARMSDMPGLLGTIFAKPQSKINDPAKLALLVRLIDEENWSSLDIRSEEHTSE